jgi:hypothetical protein
MQRTSGHWVTRLSVPGGVPYQTWERFVPRIGDAYTDCAIYIYSSVADAREGARQGGSGFLVVIRSKKHPHFEFVYAITNWHVVSKACTPVIRVNRKDGGIECVLTVAADWTQHPDGNDVAAIEFQPDLKIMKYRCISLDQFLTHQRIADEDVGIGDEVFMVGRFIGHDGRQKNAPAVRFGNIAMMHNEKIRTDYGLEQESFLVEARSLPGYSGSAVFLYTAAPMNDMSRTRSGTAMEPLGAKAASSRIILPFDTDLRQLAVKQMSAKGPYLLGIDWCHLNNQIRVRDRDGKELPEGYTVNENTGMAGVIPAWKIRELLQSDELRERRRIKDAELSEAANHACMDDSPCG